MTLATKVEQNQEQAKGPGDAQAPSTAADLNHVRHSHEQSLATEFLLRREAQENILQQGLMAQAARYSMAAAPSAAPMSMTTNGGPDHHVQSFLSILSAGARKKTEARDEDPAFAVLRQRLATIIPPDSLNKLQEACAKSAAAKNGLDQQGMLQIQQRIQNLTQDKSLLEMVMQQTQGKSPEVPPEKAQEFEELQGKVAEVLGSNEGFAQIKETSDAHWAALTEMLQGSRYAGRLTEILKDPSTRDVADLSQEEELLRDFLVAQCKVVGTDETIGLPRIAALGAAIDQQRKEIAQALLQVDRDKFLEILKNTPPEMLHEIDREFSNIHGGVGIQKTAESSFLYHSVESSLVAALLSKDQSRIEKYTLVAAIDSGAGELARALSRIAPERREAAVQSLLDDKLEITRLNRTHPENPLLFAALFNSATPKELVSHIAIGDDAKKLDAILTNKLDRISVIELHRAIAKGDGATAAAIFVQANQQGEEARKDLHRAFQHEYNGSLGQFLVDNVRTLSPEVLTAVRHAAKGDVHAVAAAEIRQALGYGAAGKQELNKVMLAYGSRSFELRQDLNKNFEHFLTAQERESVRAELAARGKPVQGAILLEDFLQTKLNGGDLQLAVSLLHNEKPSIFDLTKYSLEGTGKKNELFEQLVLNQLQNPTHGAEALSELRTAYDAYYKSLPSPKTVTHVNKEGDIITRIVDQRGPDNFDTWVLKNVSGDTERRFALFLSDPKAARTRDSFDRLVQYDQAGLGDDVAKLALSAADMAMSKFNGGKTLDFGSDYEKEVIKIRQIFENLESAEGKKRADLEKSLTAELNTFSSIRATYLVIKDVARDATVNTVAGVGGIVVMVGTAGLGTPAALAIAGGAGFGSRVVVHTVMDGHGPDSDQLMQYGKAAMLDMAGVGIGRIAGKVSIATAEKFGVHQATGGLKYYAGATAAGATGGAVFGFGYTGASQLINQQFDAKQLMWGTITGAGIGSVGSLLTAFRPSGLYSNAQTNTKVIEGKTPLVQGKTSINRSTDVEQIQVDKVLKNPVTGRTYTTTDTVQEITKHGQNAVPNALSKALIDNDSERTNRSREIPEASVSKPPIHEKISEKEVTNPFVRRNDPKKAPPPPPRIEPATIVAKPALPPKTEKTPTPTQGQAPATQIVEQVKLAEPKPSNQAAEKPETMAKLEAAQLPVAAMINPFEAAEEVPNTKIDYSLQETGTLTPVSETSEQQTPAKQKDETAKQQPRKPIEHLAHRAPGEKIAQSHRAVVAPINKPPSPPRAPGPQRLDDPDAFTPTPTPAVEIAKPDRHSETHATQEAKVTQALGDVSLAPQGEVSRLAALQALAAQSQVRIATPTPQGNQLSATANTERNAERRSAADILGISMAIEDPVAMAQRALMMQTSGVPAVDLNGAVTANADINAARMALAQDSRVQQQTTEQNREGLTAPEKIAISTSVAQGLTEALTEKGLVSQEQSKQVAEIMTQPEALSTATAEEKVAEEIGISREKLREIIAEETSVTAESKSELAEPTKARNAIEIAIGEAANSDVEARAESNGDNAGRLISGLSAKELKEDVAILNERLKGDRELLELQASRADIKRELVLVVKETLRQETPKQERLELLTELPLQAKAIEQRIEERTAELVKEHNRERLAHRAATKKQTVKIAHREEEKTYVELKQFQDVARETKKDGAETSVERNERNRRRHTKVAARSPRIARKTARATKGKGGTARA